jgi:hypothetical protein
MDNLTELQPKYTDKHRHYIYKYRQEHKEEYKTYQREYFKNVRMADPEKRERIKEINRIAARKYQQKKKENKMKFMNE